MRLADLTRHTRFLLKIELLIAEVRIRAQMRWLALMCVAAALGLLAFVMLNIAVYELLFTAWGPVGTPLILSGVDLLAAALFAIAAMRLTPGAELAMAQELRSSLISDLEADFGSAQNSLGMTSGLLDPRITGLLIPAIGTIVRALRSKKAHSSG
jgi:hypothetical protein